MHPKRFYVAAALLALLSGPMAVLPPAGAALAAGNCEPGEKSDNSTAPDARK
jgi:hypothetical protein